MQLTTREPAILGVCCWWRYALLSDFGRFVIANCHAGSRSALIPFLSPVYTKEVWLRFDGELLFGNWAIEWARTALSHATQSLSIEKLIMVIVEAPNIVTTAVENTRAKALVDVCQHALLPREIGLFSQPCVAEVSGVQSRGIGDKFACLFVHFSQMKAPPILTSIDTSRISHDSMLWLIGSNARTLEYLRIGSVFPSDLQHLVSEISGDLVFGRLREIQMTLDLEDSQLKQYNITTTHFPRLELLFVDLPPYGISPRYETDLSILEYSFLTDLFFTACSRLRSVRFPIAWDAVEMLTPTMIPKVHELMLYQISMESEHVPDTEEANMLLNNMLSLKHIRSVSLDTVSDIAVLPLHLVCTRLHSLIIPQYRLAADQMHFLLCELPSLMVLHCKLGERQSSTADKDCAINPDYISKVDHYWKNDSSITHNTHSHDVVLATPVPIRTLAICIPPDTSSMIIQLFFSVIAALPCIRTIHLPHQLNTALLQHLQQASNVSRHRWSAAMLDNIYIRALASPGPR
ncbi:hypothetical protein J3F82_004209 [Coemansia sp. RSA 637]|nr:hypothetical protein J3F82_004209 [Coemansia sp. RSA 637]